MNQTLRALHAFALALLWACADKGSQAGGTSVETTNGFAVQVELPPAVRPDSLGEHFALRIPHMREEGERWCVLSSGDTLPYAWRGPDRQPPHERTPPWNAAPQPPVNPAPRPEAHNRPPPRPQFQEPPRPQFQAPAQHPQFQGPAQRPERMAPPPAREYTRPQPFMPPQGRAPAHVEREPHRGPPPQRRGHDADGRP